jgi:hypothetical protein
MSEEELPECFVIAPIGPNGSEVRMRSDQIFNHIIKPVASECGYQSMRADKISEPGNITTQVIERILNAPMVVADLTGSNANVFYELAVRHAVRKPYIQIIQKGERIPFDTAGVRTVEIDHTNLDSVSEAKEEIRRQIAFISTHPEKIESPISHAIDVDQLRSSGNPDRRSLSEILDALYDLKRLIENRLPSPSAPLGTEQGLADKKREATMSAFAERLNAAWKKEE